jgi:mono/diheme cytochrome c family protein
MKWIKWSLVLIIALLAAGPVAQLARAQTKPKVDMVPVRASSSVEGQDLYVQYCAVCHGKDGIGHGPAAPALKAQPTDLTQIAKKNGGKFPAIVVQQAIANSDSIAAHGAPGMPVWGTLLEAQPGDPAVSTLRVHNLTTYIEGMQKK